MQDLNDLTVIDKSIFIIENNSLSKEELLGINRFVTTQKISSFLSDANDKLILDRLWSEERVPVLSVWSMENF